jgi:proprotein convertase subtilisin/kexin type 5
LNASTCDPICPDGKYGDTDSGYCLECNPACATCSSFDNKSCQSCRNGFFLQMVSTGTNHICVETCLSGTYANILNR